MGKKKSKAIRRKRGFMTPANTREFLTDVGIMRFDPEKVLKNFGRALERSMYPTSKKSKDDAEKEMNRDIYQAMGVVEIDSNILLTKTCGKEYKPLAIELCRLFRKEFGSEPSKKALIELTAGAFVRYLEHSADFRKVLDDKYLSNVKNSYYNMIGKEVDRAYRQYINGIMTLHQMNGKGLTVNIKTDTALVAQNQQINTYEQSNKER